MSQKYIGIDPNNFKYNKKLGLYIYPTEAQYENGEIITNVDFFQAFKLAEQHGLVIPTSAQRGEERERMQKLDEEAGRSYDDEESQERSYITGVAEFTGSLLAFVDGDYPEVVCDLLRKKIGKKPSKNVFLIDVDAVDTDNGKEYISSGTVSDVTEIDGNPFPKYDGYIQEFNGELGLPTKLGDEPRDEYHGAYFWVIPEGVRATLRGYWYGSASDLGGRFGVGAGYGPSVSAPNLGFRVASKDGKVLILRSEEHTLTKKA